MFNPFNKNKAQLNTFTGGEPFFYDNGSKTGILLLHGFTSTPRQFRELGRFLSDKGFNVYAPALAGHSASPADLQKTKAEDWRRQAETDFLKLREKSQRIFIIGNSFGGNVAFYLARRFPDDIAGVVSLGTPVTLRFQKIIKARIFLYGWLKQYYSKPQRVYKIDYTDMVDEISYPVIPLRGFSQFLKFIREETVAHLPEVKTPVLIIHASVDPVVHPKSAQYIHQNLGSGYKSIFWFDSKNHSIVDDKEQRQELFKKINEFILELNNQAENK